MGYAIGRKELNPKSHTSHRTWQIRSRVNSLCNLLLPFLFLLAACASTPPAAHKGDSYTIAGKRYYPISSSSGFVQRGLASWYGGKFHGRIIDLTYTSAHELDMLEDGVVQVKIEALGYAHKKREAGKWVQVYEKPASYTEGDFTIQVGAFALRENALRLHASLSRKYRETSVMVFDRGDERFYRVRVGRYSRLEHAEAGAKRLQQQGFPNAFAVARDK